MVCSVFRYFVASETSDGIRTPVIRLVTEPGELQLTCRSEDVPQSTITLYFQGLELHPTDYRYRVLHNGRLAIPITRCVGFHASVVSK